MPEMNEPNGGSPLQLPLSGEMVIGAAQVSVGKAASGETVLIVEPQQTALKIVLVMREGAGEVGRALIAQDTGLIVPPQ